MARIVCFSDSSALVRTVRHGLSGRDHALFPLPGSQLSDSLRRTVRQLAPDVVLLELTSTLDNPFLLFFLRSDAATRDVPVIVVAPDGELAPYADALGADGFLSDLRPESLVRALGPHLPQPAPAHAPALLAAPPRRTPALRRLPERRAARATGLAGA